MRCILPALLVCSLLSGCAFSGNGQVTPAKTRLVKRDESKPAPAKVTTGKITRLPDGTETRENEVAEYAPGAMGTVVSVESEAQSAGAFGSGLKDFKLGDIIAALDYASVAGAIMHMFAPQFSLPSAYYIGCILVILVCAVMAYVRKSLFYLIGCGIGVALIILGGFITAYPLLAFGIIGSICAVIALDLVLKLNLGSAIKKAVGGTIA